jgi:hypothetical protein
MEKSRLFVLILLAGLFVFALAMGRAGQPDTGALWKKVREAENNGLPRTAITYLKQIYEISVSQKNNGEALRAMIRQIVLESVIKGNKPEDKVNRLQGKLEASPPEIRTMLKVVLAQWYWHYYSRNRWRFLKRSQTRGLDDKDFTTWDLPKLFRSISVLYRDILKDDKKLKSIPLSDFDDFLEKGNLPAALRPTLYDFVAFEALQFYTSGEQVAAMPEDAFEVSADSDALAPAADFLNWNPDTADSDSPRFLALRLFQDVLRFHQEDKNSDPFIDADIHRLRYVRNVATGDGVVSRFIERLKEIIADHPDSPLSSLARYYWAMEMRTRGELVRAVEIARQGHREFPGSRGGVNCLALIMVIERKEFDLKTEKVVLPDRPSRLVLEYKNIDTLFFRVIRDDPEAHLAGGTGRNFQQLSGTVIQEMLSQETVARWSISLKPTIDYKSRKTEIAVPALKPGYYRILASFREDFSQPANKIQHCPLWVSRIALLTRGRGGILEGFALEGENSRVIENALVTYYQYDYNAKKYQVRQQARTDRAGYFSLGSMNDYRNYSSLVCVRDPRLGLYIENRMPYLQTPAEIRGQRTILFTDRALYRPGQMIHFKGICLDVDQEQNTYRLLPREKVGVALRDVNNQEVSSLELVTNDFGSFSGTFVAPSDRLTGSMSLVALHPSGYATVRVEEYKRPKFQVSLQMPENEYRLNDRVELAGEALAYTGAPIDLAKVSFRVVREVRYPGWWLYWFGGSSRNETREIAHGTLETDESGRFRIVFKAIPDLKISPSSNPVFSYKVQAEVTDNSGETRGAETHVRLGYAAIQARMWFANWQEEGSPLCLNISTTTLNGQNAAARGRVEIFRLQEPETPIPADMIGETTINESPAEGASIDRGFPDSPDWKKWPTGKMVFRRKFETRPDSATPCTECFKLKMGLYRIKLITGDSFGNPVEAYEHVLVHRPAGDRFKIPLPFHIFEKKIGIEVGETFEALWGTGYPKGPVLIEVFRDNQLLSRTWTPEKKTQGQIRIPVDETMRGGFTVVASFFRENRHYEKTMRVTVPWSNKNLQLRWQTFRSKLQPGQSETWALKIRGPEAEIRAAEMVATLYDDSLDQYAGHYFPGFNGIFRIDRTYIQSLFSNIGLGFHSFFDRLNPVPAFSSETYHRFPDEVLQNLFGFDYGVRYAPKGRMTKEAESGSAREEGLALPQAAAKNMVMGVSGGVQDEGKKSGHEADRSANIDLSKVQARKNLNETAFFYPHLMTDENGVVTIEFKIPEALTEWRFIGFAHTRDLESGMLEGRTVTQKELMVQPNPPRFFRQGDIMEFTVKVSNMTEQPADGKLRLSFFDPATEAHLDKELKNRLSEQAFSIPAKQSKTLSFPITVPDRLDLVSYRAVGATAEFSDGEEGVLPVLSRRILVQESIPLWISGKGEKRFTFKKLLESSGSQTLLHQSLTVQMASNPAWYAVQALPVLMEFPYECSEQVFNRLYANALGQKIVNSSPRIRRIFDLWKNTPALVSNLEKNQELKSVLLQESPWVSQAKNETQAKRQVALLFDDNRLDRELKQAYNKLKNMQLNDGSWPWFPGGPGNSYITLYILTGFGRLRHLGVEGIPRDLAEKAIRYTDGWILEIYQELARKNRLNLNNIDSTIALYLYARSFYLKDVPVPDQNRVAVDYFLKNAARFWLKLGYRQSQGHLALAFSRFSMAEPAEKIMRSLKERSRFDQELGRYWSELEFSWWWFRAPIETQAVMIEAFDEVTHDARAVEECKIWLLKQKQTQDWKTTKATADAVYALVLRGVELLASDELVEVSLGGTTVEPEKVEAGTGFYEKRFGPAEITPEMGKVDVVKKDRGIAWGGVHWHYLEDISKITPHAGNPLTLKKRLFVRRLTADGPVIEPLSGKLETGDLIRVRIELRVDRDMEYVHMKDHRASGLEPENVLSQYKYQDGLVYYEATGDAATHFFIDYLPKGTYVFEYSLRVVHRGVFQNGMAHIECMYAPEFNSHSESVKLVVR